MSSNTRRRWAFTLAPDGVIEAYQITNPRQAGMWPAELSRLGLGMMGPVTVESLAVAALFLFELDPNPAQFADWRLCVRWVLALVANAGSAGTVVSDV
jgi:hypothetical protein